MSRSHPSIRSRPFRGVVIASLVIGCLPSIGQGTPIFDDIDLWVGEGPNRAGFVIDWDEAPGAGNSLAWGYRWSGAATGADMLQAIVTADERLFAKLGGATLLFGLGYDLDQVNPFALSDGTSFDETGVAQTTGALNAISVHAGDLYGEGWDLFDFFWHYAVASKEFADGWQSSNHGMVTRALADGDWDAWTFATYLNFEAFPDDPQAAMPPSPPGDYNGDRVVDAADYTLWRDTFNMPVVPAGQGADGDGDGFVDSDDYFIWRKHFGVSSNASLVPSPAHVTPEPKSFLLLMISGCSVLASRRFN